MGMFLLAYKDYNLIWLMKLHAQFEEKCNLLIFSETNK